MAGLHLLTLSLIKVSNINFLQSLPVSALSSLIRDFIQLQCAKQLLQMRRTTSSKYKWFWQESVGGWKAEECRKAEEGGVKTKLQSQAPMQALVKLSVLRCSDRKGKGKAHNSTDTGTLSHIIVSFRKRNTNRCKTTYRERNTSHRRRSS